MKGKSVCRTQGGRSTGPKTPEGRQRCVDSHGRETRAKRVIRAEKLRELRELEGILDALNKTGA